MTVLWTILFIITFTLRAMEQAIMWSKDGAEAFKWNEHILMVLSRIMIFAIPLLAFFAASVEDYVAAIVAFLPMFYFVHNGVYYETRNRIDGAYPKGFFDKSTSSSANLPTFGFILRLALFLLGIGLIFIYYFIIKN